MTIRVFFAITVLAGVVGGLALSFERRWAASLLGLSWLGVLIDGSWASSWYSGRLQWGAVDLLLATVFVAIAVWTARQSLSQRTVDWA